CTSSQPSSPHWSRICLVACTMSGTVAYSQLAMPRLYRAVNGNDTAPVDRHLVGSVGVGGVTWLVRWVLGASPGWFGGLAGGGQRVQGVGGPAGDDLLGQQPGGGWAL